MKKNGIILLGILLLSSCFHTTENSSSEQNVSQETSKSVEEASQSSDSTETVYISVESSSGVVSQEDIVNNTLDISPKLPMEMQKSSIEEDINMLIN